MLKNFIKLFFNFILILILFISYLSIFGIKTNKFNEIIKSQLIKQIIKLDIN